MDEINAKFKQTIKRGLRYFGLDIRRIGHDLMDFLSARQVDVVLDVGANIGQFGKSLRSCGYRGKIVSFEPAEAIYQRLKTAAERDGNWETHHVALGSAAGHMVLNVSYDSRFSSILDQTAVAQRFDTNASVVQHEEVGVLRLDDFFPPYRDRTVFLKIDTQGYEYAILEGAPKTLPQVVGVQLELPIVHLYKNTWSLVEALAYMRHAGFVPAQLTPVNWLSDDSASLLEIDAVFRREIDGPDGRPI
jgi:FkbM family methyltransferase